MIAEASLFILAGLLAPEQAERRVSFVCGVRDGIYDPISSTVKPSKSARTKVFAFAFTRTASQRIDISTVAVTDEKKVLRGGVAKEFMFNDDISFAFFVEGPNKQTTTVLGQPNPATGSFAVQIVGVDLGGANEKIYALRGVCRLVPIQDERPLIVALEASSSKAQ